jgi:hypothetical protein
MMMVLSLSLGKIADPTAELIIKSVFASRISSSRGYLDNDNAAITKEAKSLRRELGYEDATTEITLSAEAIVEKVLAGEVRVGRG